MVILGRRLSPWIRKAPSSKIFFLIITDSFPGIFYNKWLEQNVRAKMRPLRFGQRCVWLGTYGWKYEELGVESLCVEPRIFNGILILRYIWNTVVFIACQCLMPSVWAVYMYTHPLIETCWRIWKAIYPDIRQDLSEEKRMFPSKSSFRRFNSENWRAN